MPGTDPGGVGSNPTFRFSWIINNNTMNDYFKEFLESINNDKNPMVKPILNGYETMVESHRISEYEYYKEQLKKESAFNEIMGMLKSATTDKQKSFLINNLINRIGDLAGSFDKNLIKILLEYFGVQIPK